MAKYYATVNPEKQYRTATWVEEPLLHTDVKPWKTTAHNLEIKNVHELEAIIARQIEDENKGLQPNSGLTIDKIGPNLDEKARKILEQPDMDEIFAKQLMQDPSLIDYIFSNPQKARLVKNNLARINNHKSKKEAERFLLRGGCM